MSLSKIVLAAACASLLFPSVPTFAGAAKPASLEVKSGIVLVQRHRHERERRREEREEFGGRCKPALKVVGASRPWVKLAQGSAIKAWRKEATTRYGDRYGDWEFAEDKRDPFCFAMGDYGWERCEVYARPCVPRGS
jgi:hypothetical protein